MIAMKQDFFNSCADVIELHPALIDVFSNMKPMMNFHQKRRTSCQVENR